MLTVIRQNGTIRDLAFARKELPETLESRRQRYCSGRLELSTDPKLPSSLPPILAPRMLDVCESSLAQMHVIFSYVLVE